MSKLVIIGDQAVGKTSILNRKVNNEFTNELMATSQGTFRT